MKTKKQALEANIIIEPSLFSEENIKKIESLRKAKYVLDTEKDGHPLAVFYQEDFDGDKYASPYFGLYRALDGTLMITSAEFVESQEIDGLLTNKGNIIFSRERHDYYSKDGAFIDGGRGYTRYGGEFKKIVPLEVRKGRLQVKETVDV